MSRSEKILSDLALGFLWLIAVLVSGLGSVLLQLGSRIYGAGVNLKYKRQILSAEAILESELNE